MITVLEMIGTIAFAISGALIALESHMDLFGVVALGVITATGGGIARDITLGKFPPQAFINPIYVLVAAITSVIVFVWVYIGIKVRNEKKSLQWKNLLFLLDSLGLAIFTVMGVSTAWQLFETKNIFLCVFSGVVTGVGGGLARDVIVNQVPYIFSKHIYAIASIVGGLVCALLLFVSNELTSITVGTIVVFTIRLLAAHFRWSLPKVHHE